MKKLLYFFLLVSITSCAKKKWDKEFLVEDCKKEIKKDKKNSAAMTDAQLDQVCSCAADKMLVKYKSQDEFRKESDEVKEKIGYDCAIQVLMPGGTDNFNTQDTTVLNPADSTDQ
jgi:hypothetical protein